MFFLCWDLTYEYGYNPFVLPPYAKETKWLGFGSLCSRRSEYFSDAALVVMREGGLSSFLHTLIDTKLVRIG